MTSRTVQIEYSACRFMPGLSDRFVPVVRESGRVIYGFSNQVGLPTYASYEEAVAAARAFGEQLYGGW